MKLACRAMPRASSSVATAADPAPFWSQPLPPPPTACLASEPYQKPAPSQSGIQALLSQALDSETARLLGLAYSPLFPKSSPYASLDDIPAKRHAKDAHMLDAISQAIARRKQELCATAGEVVDYLDYTDDDVRALALKLAKEARPPLHKLALAEKLLGTSIPGKTLATKLARLSDARYWRRALRVRLLRAREHFFLRLGLIGKGLEAYASQAAVQLRTTQLRRQAEWMANTVVLPRFVEQVEGEELDEPLTLDKVAAGPRERFAKLYTFVKAADTLAQEAGLSAAMVTLTLEPEWHPNPAHGTNSWNGATPRDAHQSLCRRWQAILRDLHRSGVRLSGLRVAEPHQDGCPHWHIWMLYQAEHETRILGAMMKYFPNKMKVRTPSAHGGKRAPADLMFETRDHLLGNASRPLAYAKEVAQVEVSRIDRSISCGASYAMKYLLKTVDAGDSLNREAGLFPADEEAARKKKEQHAKTAKRVDAYRSVWGLNQGQLFGIAKCLTVWDELRRMNFAPKHKLLRKLWVLARGSDEEGRIEAGTGQRGDAVGFIKALGGLDACRAAEDDARRRYVLGRLVEQAVNAYGEAVERTKGITLLLKRKVQVARKSVSRATGKPRTSWVWRTETAVIVSLRSRWVDWMLVPKRLARQTLDLPRVLEEHARQQAAAKKRRRLSIQADAGTNAIPVPV